jgi:hypothetical protein
LRAHSQEQKYNASTQRKNSKEFVNELVKEIKSNLIFRKSMDNFRRPSISTEGFENYQSN